MTTHEYARYLLTLEDLPLLINNKHTERSTYLDDTYVVYWKPEWDESIFPSEVEAFGHKFEDLEKAYEVFVE
ncbi:hypothetical protein NVP1161O_188 [Vibrio phage 1.161.O._10N.261.48.C5]|nr:hypothetical protein NVP1161O_188 [Vibrio phage 1.161.O._10N.261.48.C5]